MIKVMAVMFAAFFLTSGILIGRYMERKLDLIYLTVDIAAAQLGISVRTLNRWRLEGIGPPYILIGKKKTGYRQQDINDYIDQRVFNPANKKKD